MQVIQTKYACMCIIMSLSDESILRIFRIFLASCGISSLIVASLLIFFEPWKHFTNCRINIKKNRSIQGRNFSLKSVGDNSHSAYKQFYSTETEI